MTDFPPQYAGNPTLYLGALFSLTLICAISIAHLLAMGTEARRNSLDRNVSVKRVVEIEGIRGWLTLLGSYRSIIAGLLITFVFGALPDVFLLYAWGEVSMSTIYFIWEVDRLFDGLALLPFLVSMGIMAWVSQALPQRLAQVDRTPLQQPRLFMFTKYLKIFGIVLVISLGVTLGKVNG